MFVSALHSVFPFPSSRSASGADFIVYVALQPSNTTAQHSNNSATDLLFACENCRIIESGHWAANKDHELFLREVRFDACR